MNDQVLGESLNVSLERMKTHFYRYGKVNDVLECLNALDDIGTVGSTVGGSAQCVAVVGEAGCGKTAVVRNWAGTFKARETPLGRIEPVVYVEVPSTATQRALVGEILARLGAPQPRAASRGSMLPRLRHHIKEMEVRTIVLDEVHHMLDDRNMKLNEEAADTVKYILNSGNCRVVLVGLPKAQLIFTKDSQLTRRRLGIFRLDPLAWEGDDKELFGMFLESFEEVSTGLSLAILAEDDIAQRINFVAEGYLGRAGDLIVKATYFALRANAQALGKEHLAKAAEWQRDGWDDGWMNPFTVGDDAFLKVAGEAHVDHQTGLFRGNRKKTERDVIG